MEFLMSFLLSILIVSLDLISFKFLKKNKMNLSLGFWILSVLTYLISFSVSLHFAAITFVFSIFTIMALLIIPKFNPYLNLYKICHKVCNIS